MQSYRWKIFIEVVSLEHLLQIIYFLLWDLPLPLQSTLALSNGVPVVGGVKPLAETLIKPRSSNLEKTVKPDLFILFRSGADLLAVEREDNQHEVLLNLIHDPCLENLPVLVRGHVVLHLVHNNRLSDVLHSSRRSEDVNQSVDLLLGLGSLGDLLDEIHHHGELSQHQGIVFWVSRLDWRLQFLRPQLLHNLLWHDPWDDIFL